jgi:hypothetical protein
MLCLFLLLKAGSHLMMTLGFWMAFQFKRCPICSSRRSKFIAYIKPEKGMPFSTYSCISCNTEYVEQKGQIIVREDSKYKNHPIWGNLIAG